MHRLLFALAAAAALPAAATAQQVFYTFTSGPAGDGFLWPASPTGLLPEGYAYLTPDGVDIYNYSGNNLFFDDNYQVAGNAFGIDADAMWGNPYSGSVDIYLSGLDTQSVEFNFAQSVGGEPFQTNDYIDIYIEDSEGRQAYYSAYLGNTFTGLGGFDGYSDTVQFDTSFLYDEFENVDGGPLIDIDYFYIELYSLDNSFEPAEFAIDNFSLDGGSGNGGSGLFPSVNDGQFDVTGSTLGANSLRGTGTFSRGVEVTNSAPTGTTFSIELLPGGDLTSDSPPSGQAIDAGESLFSPDVALVDRSLPSGKYQSDFRVINEGDPSDPDDVATLSVDLYDSESLSGNFAGVEVAAAEMVTLSNAAAPAEGFRAAVKVIGSQTSGPFTVDGFANEQRLLDGDSIQATATFMRFGRLSGPHTGSYTVSLEQTAYIVNDQVDFETFLANAESVPDVSWTLNYALADTTTDSVSVASGSAFAETVGVNSAEVAATLIDGVSSADQSVSMQFVADPSPASADILGVPVELAFGGGGGDLYVQQFTYDELLLAGDADESDLRLLWYDAVAGEWALAVDGNSAGTPSFFAGSWEEYLAGPGGGALGAGDLGAYGVDAANNHVWAALDHASLFAVGVLSAPSPLAGDYNQDGVVNAADYTVWRDNQGTSVVLPNDATPGTVTTADYDVWLANYGAGVAGASSRQAVPEPTSILSMAVLLVLALGTPGLFRSNKTQWDGTIPL
ncbi:hypothetical protein Pla123a_39590 [Posidoniimonas polymericola]|uniref:PEP-CTERM protein-sorting domain-containing protein n=1 Tax=Posidoniimonas polymericola TaxID=2528002 RepID=A0A5C5YGF8_9BACT|nr:hypothetical protein [Posidoniimonas polymericola]TWT73621.1 hypothetical protein Pla123a_39590 [Posidoniimonas polymericola]